MKKIGIYPGSFQPPTKAHFEAYKRLRSIVGDSDVFIITTDREPTPDAPLNFGDKQQIWVRHGVPASHIIRVDKLPTDNEINVQNWRPTEILEKFSIDSTIVVVSLNEKEASLFSKRKATPDSVVRKDTIKLSELFGKNKQSSKNTENNPKDIVNKKIPKEIKQKEIWLKPDSSIGFFQPYKGSENSLKSFKYHAYVIKSNDTQIDGKPISTSNVRYVLGSSKYTDDQKMKFFKLVFGWFDIGLYKLLEMKFRMANSSSLDTINEPSSTPSPFLTTEENSNIKSYDLKNKLEEMVIEIMNEIVKEDYASTLQNADNSSTATSTDIDNTTPKTDAQKKSDNIKKQALLTTQKKEAEAESKLHKQQHSRDTTAARNYTSFQKKTDRQKIDNINKQISSTRSTNNIKI